MGSLNLSKKTAVTAPVFYNQPLNSLKNIPLKNHPQKLPPFSYGYPFVFNIQEWAQILNSVTNTDGPLLDEQHSCGTMSVQSLEAICLLQIMYGVGGGF